MDGVRSWPELRQFIERVRLRSVELDDAKWGHSVCNHPTNLLYYSNDQGEHYFAPLNFIAHVAKNNNFEETIKQEGREPNYVEDHFVSFLKLAGYKKYDARLETDRQVCIQLFPLYAEKYKLAKPDWKSGDIHTRRKYLEGNRGFFSFWIIPVDVLGHEPT